MNTNASVVEVNFDCLVGPTHHFAGLSYGNLASTKNKEKRSNPKKAALQGLEKMRFLAESGFIQGILPPHPRPHMSSFHNLGFYGPDHEILQKAYRQMPHIFNALCSSSFMWAANAATVSSSCDSKDGLCHISPANLITMLHRSIEHEFCYRIFKQIFADEKHFLVHPSLISHEIFSDEGAANHNRLTPCHDDKSLQIFVYGKKRDQNIQKSRIFPARQSLLACEALARRHKLDEKYFLCIEQNPLAIDAGAFHNDVVAVANESVFLCHEYAFVDQAPTFARIRERFYQLFGRWPFIIEVSNKELAITEAVSSYLFNSQLLTKKNGKMMLFAPLECEANKNAHDVIQRIIVEKNPIDEVKFFDLSESMANGGGPACLRLRVPLTQEELSSVKEGVLFTQALYESLKMIIEKYYEEDLTVEYFFDKNFLANNERVLEEMGQILGLRSIYDFPTK